MKTYNNLFEKVYSFNNLLYAHSKARKGKSKKEYVKKFEGKLLENLLRLKEELKTNKYKPKALENFIIRDPKTRKISKSDFKDRIVHHALCNIIEPIFDKTFIYDSYANRNGKGTLKAIKRFDYFKRKVSNNNTRPCYVLKEDIRHYFDNVGHEVLMNIINKRIKDKYTIYLIKGIISNYTSKEKNKGMPLGNLTSQFFANVYLNELDQFVKHKLKAQYYIRYVDDFVILSHIKEELEYHKKRIDIFLKNNLHLELHPDKSKIININKGVCFLGFRIFSYHKLLKKSNLKKSKRKLNFLYEGYKEEKIDYDCIYDYLEGWLAHSRYSNIYSLKKKIIKDINKRFLGELSTKEINKLLKLS